MNDPGPASNYGPWIATDDIERPTTAWAQTATAARASSDDRPDATGRRHRSPEWYVTDERVVRIGAVVLAILLAVATVVWARTALHLFDPPANVCAGCADDWFRRTELVLAIVGVSLSLLSVAYLLHIASTGRTWRRRRLVSGVLAAAIAAWSLLVLGVAVF